MEDTGIGIEPQYLTRVFEKFFRVPGQEHIDSGLGLTIAKEIVEAHGGTIEAASQVGKGTKFTFTLQAAQEPGAKLKNQERLKPYGYRLDNHYPDFLCYLPGLCRLPGQGGQDMENLIVGLVAVALIIYLFVVLLRPQKFYTGKWRH